MDTIDFDKMVVLLSNFIPEYRNKSGLFLCLEGSSEVLINDQLYQMKRGTLYIISPLVTIYKVSQSPDFKGIHIIDEIEVFYSVIHSIIDTILHLKLRNSPCLQLVEDDIQFIIHQKELIDKKRQSVQNPVTEEEATLIRHMMQLIEQETLLEVISIYFRERIVKSETIGKSESVVYNFIYSLHMNYKTKRTVAFYAEEAKLSTGHFTSIIKQKTGQTPSEWIIAITIVNAKLLLEKSQKSIKEIAGELNFPEQFTFRKYFKQYVGIPPKQYRLSRRTDSEETQSEDD